MKNQLHIDDWVIAMVYVEKSPEEIKDDWSSKKRRVLAYAKVTNLGFDNIGLRAYPYYPNNNTYVDVVVDDDITCKCTEELSSELNKFAKKTTDDE